AVVKGVRLNEEEWTRSRCMIVDSNFRVIAASDGQGILTELLRLRIDDRQTGYYRASDGTIVSFAATPGYETYRGLGWYGVVCQKPS
ncbi:MAG TPA: chemotaxis protein, partial [Paraburkholderia sp.]|nr:chemotaxis protein [Paraburkholderia sp.]